MSNLGIRLNGLNPAPVNNAPAQKTQLTGIIWNNPAPQQQTQVQPQPQQQAQWQDQQQMNNYDYGQIPSNDLPPMFPEQNYQPDNTQYSDQHIGPASDSKGLATGIGVTIGGIAGAVVGSKVKIGAKWGALIGLTVGGVVGNMFDK